MRLTISLVIFVVSCSNPTVKKREKQPPSSKQESENYEAGKGQDGKPKQAEGGSSPKTSPEGGSETISPPGNISGASLACMLYAPASDANPTTSYGCRFADNEGQRLSADKVAETFTFEAIPPEGVTVAVLPNPNADWEVLYSFTASTAEASALGAVQSKIVLTVQNTKDGKATDEIQTILSDVSFPLETWAPACQGDVCAFRQISSGLLWAKSPGLILNRSGAIAACEILVVGSFSDWRLPTEAEAQNAFTDKISDLSGSNRLNIRTDVRYWTDAVVAPANLNGITIEWDGGSLLERPVTSLQHTVCVR